MFLKQVPVPSLDSGVNEAETIVTYKMSELKRFVRFDDRNFSLFAVILFHPPQDHKSLGHYVAAVNANETYIVFDDHRKKTYVLDEACDVVIHCLYYIDAEFLADNNSTFEISSVSHSDESLYRLYHNIKPNNGDQLI